MTSSARALTPPAPAPHPAFAAAFTAPFYYDEGNDFAPFGSDEGADLMAETIDRRDELDACSTVRQILEYGTDEPLGDQSDNGPDVDGFVLGAGFGLIYLTGHIDTEGKRLTLDALRRTDAFYARQKPTEPTVMIRDLEAFPASDC